LAAFEWFFAPAGLMGAFWLASLAQGFADVFSLFFAFVNAVYRIVPKAA